jgi:ABC-type multidrug transport system fused ATPase/permease subunit
MLVSLFVILTALMMREANAFQSMPLPPSLCQRTEAYRWMQATSTRRPMVVDPIGLVTGMAVDMNIGVEVGVALVSVAAGAMSQAPRIQKLERELQTTRASLDQTEAEMVQKIHLLEEQLYAMDLEFEEQTAKFKKSYDVSQRQKMEEFKETLKKQFQFKLEIQLAQAKSDKLLNEILPNESSRVDKQEQLTQLKLKQGQLEDLNAQLEQALRDTENELKRFRDESSKKTFLFWKF